MKTLVIGASGLVGGALLKALEKGGVEAAGAYLSKPLPGGIPLDIRDSSSVRSCLAELKPEVIFLAVNTPGGVDYCEEHPAEAESLHLHGTRNVAQSAKACGARVVYYSTDYIFNGAAGPYSEEDPPHPINAYGRMKQQAEETLLSIVPESLILRTTAVFGWRRSSLNFAMQVWENLQAGKQLRVPSDQWGNPTLADYLAEVSVRLTQMGEQGVWNVAGKDRMPRSELAKVLARAMALDPALILPVASSKLKQRAARPLQGGLKTTKLERTLGTESLNLQESLKRFCRHWRSDTHITPTPTAASSETVRLKQEILAKVRQYYELAHKPQPFVPYKTRIQYSGRVFAHEEMVNLVDSALDFWLTLGDYGELFERKMRQFLSSRDFVLVNSGSTANLTAVLALMSNQLENPLRPGDEVITAAVTFPTTLAPLVHSGLIPVFVDAEVGTYNINPHLIEQAISKKTRGILIPHTLGNPCDMEIIGDLVKRHHLYLLEDSCDSLGAVFKDRLVGTWGDLGTLSFYPAHQITLGEGGGVIVNNPRLSRIVRSVRDWGRDCWCAPGESNTCGKRFGWKLGDLPKSYDHKYIYSNIGYNFKPTDLQAAIGAAQADRIGEFVEKRRHNFTLLYEGLKTYQDHLILPKLDPRTKPSWFGFPITVNHGVSKDELVQWLENANIETRGVFGGNILRQPGYRNIPCRIPGSLTETDRIMQDTFFIGVYPGLTDEMIRFMIRSFSEFFARRTAPGR